ncbi:MAG: hypothetical protein GTO14_11115, partial [Anaerolineales bacterium]|nr:hypothetical protein [Anaerolineales bacterium]
TPGAWSLFAGQIDEVRISNVHRSDCWIETEFNNQKWPNKAQYPTNGFITVDSEVSLNSAPSAPTTPYSNNTTAQSGQTNPTDITDPTPAFSAIYEDPDPGDTANKYRVEVNTQSDFAGTVMWDSGASGTTMADTITGNRSPDIIYAGSGLQNATTYYWRITFWDDSNAQGTVSATQQFTTTTVDTYSHRKRITIDNALVSGSSNLDNFPFMVKLTGADFQEIEDNTRPDGFDIIFRAEDA